MTAEDAFFGAWRIVHMDVWDTDYLDLVAPAQITFEADGDGEFQFGTVHGWLDCRFGQRDGQSSVEFSWEGFNDTDPACGRGWAALISGVRMNGHLFIHTSDDSPFSAIKQ